MTDAYQGLQAGTFFHPGAGKRTSNPCAQGQGLDQGLRDRGGLP